MSDLISDGGGFQQAIGWRGASGLRPCIIHSNIVKKGSDLVGRTQGYVEVSNTDPTRLHQTTITEFEQCCDLVAETHSRFVARTLPRLGMYEEILKCEAQNYIEGGLAFDRRLRVLAWLACVIVDWVHTMLQDGVFTVEAWLMINAMQLRGEVLRRFLQQAWEFPCCKKKKGQDL